MMYTCGDPCVAGIDYGRESDEFSVVVIRLGPLASGSFDPTLSATDSKGRILLGKTTWSNVVWAESWKNLTAEEAADIIRELRVRYNIIHVPNIGGGLGMDKGGGGTAVRDQLAIPKPPFIDGKPDPFWEEPQRIYDPNDEAYAHYYAMDDPTKYWGGLELIKPTNSSNLEATMSSKAMLQKGQLFIAKYEPASQWTARIGLITVMGGADDSNPLYHRILIGYKGIQRLKSQLIKLQSKVTETGVMRFVMPGKKELEESKKDLYSAFIYACYMARLHLVGQTKDGMHSPPNVQPQLVQIGSEYKRGRARTTQDRTRSWTSVGWRGGI